MYTVRNSSRERKCPQGAPYPGKIAIVALLALLLTVRAVQAQVPDPQILLQHVILQLQTGQIDRSWYSFPLWQKIASDTARTAICPSLVELGPTRDVTLFSQTQLPTGFRWELMAQHSNGTSVWSMTVSN